MPKPRRWIRWGIAGGVSSPRTRPMRGGCSTGSARSAITIACCSVGRGRRATCVRRTGARLPSCRSAGPRRNFPLKAADFIARGMAEGPALGHVLTLAEDAWLAADFPLEEAALASIADQAAARISLDPETLTIVSGFADISIFPAPAGRVDGVVRFDHRWSRRLRHGRPDCRWCWCRWSAPSPWCDHRDLCDFHQFQPCACLSALCRSPPCADRASPAPR